MKVIVEVPHTGMFHWQFVSAYPGLLITSMMHGVTVAGNMRGFSLIYRARNQAAADFLQSDADALLFLDSDMDPPEDMLIRLLKHDKPVVSALAFRREPDFAPCIFKELSDTGYVYHDYPKGLIPVAAVGMACCLIKREVFEKVPPPWFEPTKQGEDISFCRRVTQAQIPIYCDTELVCGHVGTMTVREGHYKAYRQREKEEGRLK